MDISDTSGQGSNGITQLQRNLNRSNLVKVYGELYILLELFKQPMIFAVFDN